MEHPVFPAAALSFLSDLRQNNDRVWFSENRHYYDNVIVPALSETLAYLWEGVKEAYPDYVAIPKVNKSFYRIYRDIRFSKDKSPFKTHIGVLVYRKVRKQSPFIYLHFAPEEVFWACGLYAPEMPLVRRYREWIADSQINRRLGEAIERVRERYTVNEPQMKRVPREYKDVELPYPELLRYKGIYAHQDREPGDWLETEPWLDEAIELCRYCRPFMDLIEEWADYLPGSEK